MTIARTFPSRSLVNMADCRIYLKSCICVPACEGLCSRCCPVATSVSIVCKEQNDTSSISHKGLVDKYIRLMQMINTCLLTPSENCRPLFENCGQPFVPIARSENFFIFGVLR